MKDFTEKAREYAHAQNDVIDEARALIDDLRKAAKMSERGDRATPIQMLNDRHRRIQAAIEHMDSIKLYGA